MSNVYDWFQERLEIQAIADGEVSSGILPRNPLENGELTKDEISRCENDDTISLNIKSDIKSDALEQVTLMCKEMLVNNVIEDFEIVPSEEDK